MNLMRPPDTERATRLMRHPATAVRLRWAALLSLTSTGVAMIVVFLTGADGVGFRLAALNLDAAFCVVVLHLADCVEAGEAPWLRPSMFAGGMAGGTLLQLLFFPAHLDVLVGLGGVVLMAWASRELDAPSCRWVAPDVPSSRASLAVQVPQVARAR
jgi:hypothetical protein